MGLMPAPLVLTAGFMGARGRSATTWNTSLTGWRRPAGRWQWRTLAIPTPSSHELRHTARCESEATDSVCSARGCWKPCTIAGELFLAPKLC